MKYLFGSCRRHGWEFKNTVGNLSFPFFAFPGTAVR